MTMQMKAEPEWLRATAKGNVVQVDREAEVIRGYIVAQEGPFKSEGRGEFDKPALREIVKLMRASPNGLKSRFTHPDMTSDGLGRFLGRIKNPRLDKISTRESEGGRRDDEITVVRADLHLDPASHTSPSGDLGTYVMDLAESDPDAMSSSLVLKSDKQYRLDNRGRPQLDDDGVELPPLWHPTQLHASDVVDTGDAVDGILSVSLDAEGLPDSAVRQGAKILDRVFAGQDREVIEARLDAWKERYLTRRFGEPEPEYESARDAEKARIRRRLAASDGAEPEESWCNGNCPTLGTECRECDESKAAGQ